MSDPEKALRTVSMSRALLEASRHLINRDYPNANQHELTVRYVWAQYGIELARKVAIHMRVDLRMDQIPP